LERKEEMNPKNKKAILLSTSFFLLFALVILYVPGCSMKDGFILLGKSAGPQDDSDIFAFVSSIRPRPGNPDSHYLLAGYYQERGQHREAVEEFKKALRIDPGYVKAYNGLGVSADFLGDFPRAVASYEAALFLTPKQSYLHNNLGYSYLMQGNLEKAVSAFQNAIALNPQEPRFHNNLAFAYSEKSLFQLAMEEFQKGGNEAQAHFNMAEIYLRNGQFTKAREDYATALKLNPSYPPARTAAKAADTLASIFAPSPKKERTAAEAVIPEPAKIEVKVVLKKSIPPSSLHDVTILSEGSLSFAKPVVQAFPGMDSESVNAPVPVIQWSILAKNREEGKEAQSTGQSSLAPRILSNFYGKGKGDGSGEWDSEVKMAIVSEKAVSVALEEPKDLQKTMTRKKQGTRRDIGIEVSNGNGVDHMAKRVGHYLQKKGYPVGRLTNSQHFNHGYTQIYYQEGNKEIAHQIAEQLPTHKDLIEIKKLERPTIQVKILLGKDMIPHINKFREKEGS